MKKLTRKSTEMENGIQAYSWCGLSICMCLEGVGTPGYLGVYDGLNIEYQKKSSKGKGGK